VSRVRKAVIAAAGFGSRFLPQTKAMPKEMLPIIDKPIIQYVVEELVSVGIEDIVIVTGYGKRSIEDHFDRPSQDLVRNLELGGKSKAHLLKEVQTISEMANFVYVRQKGPQGNGTPLLNTEHLMGDEPFIFTWSDDFISAQPARFAQMIEAYETYGCPVIGTIRASRPEDYDRYGYAAGQSLDEGVIRLEQIIEKPGRNNPPSELATNGGFVLDKTFFSYLHEASEQLAEDEELVTNNVLQRMIRDGRQIVAVDIQNATYYDAGNKLEYIKTVVEFALKHPELGDELKLYLRERLQLLGES
jgi:UTP--glucose-1-phosphate uridylyltransferase